MIFQSQSWTPGLRNHHTITDLFNKSSLAPIMRNALGGEPDVIPEAQGGQIALRFPLPPEEADAVAQQPEALRWGGHLDGLHTPTNGVPKGVLGTFTCLVGVALSEQLEPFCGNLGVLRGGHKINEQFIRRQLASRDGPELATDGQAIPVRASTACAIAQMSLRHWRGASPHGIERTGRADARRCPVTIS